MESTTSIELFVEILDRYVYYFDQANESVSLRFIPFAPAPLSIRLHAHIHSRLRPSISTA